MLPDGNRADPGAWRAYCAVVAQSLHQRIPDLMDMPWSELLRWYDQVRLLNR